MLQKEMSLLKHKMKLNVSAKDFSQVSIKSFDTQYKKISSVKNIQEMTDNDFKAIIKELQAKIIEAEN